jgi:hypothetical protein
MTQKTPKEQCQRRAKQIKNDYPESSYCQRLDIAAKELGFDSYQAFVKSAEVSHD